jgi:hypothetical protein
MVLEFMFPWKTMTSTPTRGWPVSNEVTVPAISPPKKNGPGASARVSEYPVKVFEKLSPSPNTPKLTPIFPSIPASSFHHFAQFTFADNCK